MSGETFEYRCSLCEQICIGSKAAEAFAHEEAKRLWGRDGHAADMDIICEDCFQEMQRAGFIPSESEKTH